MPRLGNLTEAQFPFRDRPMNVLRLRDWWGLILGVAVLMAILSLARPLHQAFAGIGARLPLVGQHIGAGIRPEEVEAEVLPHTILQ